MKIERWGIPESLPCRYDNIPKIIKEINAKILLEIGTYKGIRAEKMILAALETIGRVSYYGFDLFEDLTKEIAEREAAPMPWAMNRVYERLTGIGVHIELFKGFSRDTLPEFVKSGIRPDFVFIDGGHSFETVKNDWDYVSKIMHQDTIVVFDDYLEEAQCLGWGCNRIIDSLSKEYTTEIIKPADEYLLRKTNSSERIPSKTWLVKVWKNTA